MKGKEMEGMDDIENVGIMQGFLDSMSDDEDDDGEDDDEKEMAERRPDSPEILMNNLRGDMRSIDARREELANLVGYAAATETPETVLAMLQPVLAQQGGGGIGELPQSAPMAQGPQPPMMPPAAPPGPPPMGPGAGLGAMPPPGAMGAPPGPPPEQAPIAMAKGGYVQRFQEGSDEDGVTPVDEPSSAGMYSPEVRDLLRRRIEAQLGQQPMPVPDVQTLYAQRLPDYEKLLGGDRSASQAQMLFDVAQRAFGYAANVDERGRPMRGGQLGRLAGAFQGLPGTIGARVAEMEKGEREVKKAALSSAEKEAQRIQELNQRLQTSQDRLLRTLSGQAVKEMADEARDRTQREAVAARTSLEQNRQEQLNLRAQLRADAQMLVSRENNIAQAERKKAELENRLQNTALSNEGRKAISDQVTQVNRDIATMRVGSEERRAQARSVADMERTLAEINGRMQVAGLNNEARAAIQADRNALTERLAVAKNELEQGIAADKNVTSRLIALGRNEAQLQAAANRATTSASAGAFRGNWFMPVVTNPTLAKAFESGATDPETEARIRAALMEWGKPATTYKLDETGQPVATSISRPLPAIWRRALEARGEPVPSFQTMATTQPRTPFALPPGSPPLPGMGAGAAAQAPAEAVPGAPAPTAQPAPAAGALPAVAPTPLAPLPNGQSLFEQAAVLTGPVDAILAKASEFPLFGLFANNAAMRGEAARWTERLVEAALKNPKAPIDEQKRLRALYKVAPTISDPEKYRSDLVGIANTLYTEYRDAVDTINSDISTREMRDDARKKFTATRNLLNQLVPPVYDVATLNRQVGMTQDGRPYNFLNTLPKGTTFMFLNPRTNKLEPKTIQ